MLSNEEHTSWNAFDGNLDPDPEVDQLFRSAHKVEGDEEIDQMFWDGPEVKVVEEEVAQIPFEHVALDEDAKDDQSGNEEVLGPLLAHKAKNKWAA